MKKYLHDHVISLRREVWVHITGLTPSFVSIEMPRRESERSRICVTGIDVASFYEFDI